MAIGGGLAVQRRRRRSDTITELWPELGPNVHWLKADLQGAQMVVPDRPHSKEEARQVIRRQRSFQVRSNARRLRGGALEAKAGPRLLAIGDSVTFGWGVEDTEAYPAQLEALLRKEHEGVQVLNAGVPAQSLFGMASFLRKKGPELELDGVLWTRRVQLNLDNGIEQYRDQLEAAMAALPDAHFLVLLPPVSRFDPYGVENYSQEAQSLRRRLGVGVVELTDVFWAAQSGGATMTVDGDELVMSNEGVELSRVKRAPRDLPREIYEIFDADPAVKEHLFFDSGHPDAEGFGVFARTIAEELETRGWMA